MTAVSLDDILRSRDERRQMQRGLLKEYGKPLISLTVVMPGEIKLNEASIYTGNAAVREILKLFGDSVSYRCVNEKKPEGFEAVFVIDGDALSIKRNVRTIEESHPLGRLFDIDVIGLDGIPVSRQMCGLPERRCLICNDTARNCMRARKHPASEIIAEIERIINEAQNV